MKYVRTAQLLAAVGLSTLCGISTVFAQDPVNVASASPAGPAGPTGTFRGGLDIIGCNGSGCRGGVRATFTNDGHVRLKWKSDEDAFDALRTGKPSAIEKTMEGAGYGTVRTHRDGTVSFDNGSYNRFDNCKFDGNALTRCYFSREDNSQAVAWITLTKAP